MRKISSAAWRALEDGLPGKNLLSPSHSGFTAAARPNNLRYRGTQPLAIARCGNTEEVVHTLKWAIEQGQPFAVRSGGHSYAGYSMTEGLVIDLSRMRETSYAAATETLTMSGGARIGTILTAMKPHERMVTHGRCMTIGAAGFLLGGGIGLAMRDRGLGCDHVTEAEIVLADGSVVTANEKDHPDLFWACRGGGGGNFGIGTRFVLKTNRAEPVTAFRITWRQKPDEVLAALLSALDTAPDRLGCRILLTTISPRAHAGGRDCAVELIGQLRGPVDELTAILAPAYRIGQPATAKIQHLDYWSAQKFVADDGEPAFFQERTRFVSSAIPERAVGLIMDWARRGPGTSKPTVVRLYQMGGRVAAVTPMATAFAHRQARWLFVAASEWAREDGPPVVERATEWLDGIYDAMQGRLGHGAYVNYADPSLKEWQTAYYGANLSRLRQVKTRVDPDFRFKFAQAIPPAIRTAGVE